MVRRYGTTQVVLCLAAVIPAVLLVIATVLAFQAGTSAGSGRATGHVVELQEDDDSGVAPVVEFTPTDGPPVRFSTGVYSRPPAYVVGEPVAVRYHPDSPGDASVDDFWSRYFAAVVLGGIGLAFALPVVGASVVIRSMRRPRRSSEVSPARPPQDAPTTREPPPEDAPWDRPVDGTAVSSRGRVPLIVAAVFGSVGVILLAIGVVLAVATPGSAHADGVVVDLVGRPVTRVDGTQVLGSGDGFAPAVEFTPPGGSPVRFLAALPEDPPRYTVGEHIPVRYHAEDPRNATSDDFWSVYLAAVIVGGIGAVGTVVALILVAVSAGRRRRG